MKYNYLGKEFLAKYDDVKPPWGPVGEITFLRTYSRDGETWAETVARVVHGCYSWQRIHCLGNGLPWDDEKASRSAETMFDLMFNMKFLPPGRGLRNMGCKVVYKTGAALNNCGFVSTEDNPADAFCWAMDMLMLGVGVGFDTLGAGTKIGWPVLNFVARVYKIPDSREGWVSALRELVLSYTKGYDEVLFDYSEIRPAGSPIGGFGGVASGPEPLREMLNSVRERLDDAANKGALTSTHINDIMALIGRCVVSGGVRRSAQIAFGASDDLEFQRLKDRSSWPAENNSYRWAANHSVVCKPGLTNYDNILENTSGVDELGIFWVENAKKYGRMGRRPDSKDLKASGCNPCAEQTLEHKELCCLVEVFPSRIDSYYEFQTVLKFAYLYAKTVTTVGIHDKETQKIVERNRRIGCSLTGIQGAITKHGQPEFYSWCSRGYKYLKQLDERYSEWFNVPRSIKITSVKPSGTVSKLPGVSSGIHFPVSKYYYQVIRFAASSAYLEPLRQAGYRVVDLHPNEPNTFAAYFPVEEKDFDRCESEVSAWEQAMHAVMMQRYWADNQVSITVKYKPEERDQIPHILRFVEKDLKAISFFPLTEHSFDHAPWQPISEEEYENAIANLKTINYTGNHEHEAEDKFCSGPTCEISFEVSKA